VEQQPGLASRMLPAVAMSGVGFLGMFVSSIVTARLLGVEGRGAFAYFQTVAAGLGVFALLGIGHGQMFHAAREPAKLRHFVPNAAVVSVLLGGSAAGFYVIWTRVWQPQGSAAWTWPLAVWLLVAVPAVSMLTFQRQFLLAAHAYVLSKTNLALTQTLPLLGFAMVYVLGRPSPVSFVAALVVSQLVCLMLFHLVLTRLTPGPWSLSAPFAKASLSFGFRQYLSDIALFLTMRLDFFLVGWWLGDRGLGIYSLAAALAEIVSRVPSELGTMLFPAFAASRVPKGTAERIVRVLWTTSIGVALLLGLFAKPLVTILFGGRFAGVVPAFRWLLPGTVAWSTIYVTWNHASARGAPAIGVPVFTAAALLDLVLNAMFLKQFGVVAASLAATASYWLAAILFLVRFCRAEGCRFRDCLVPRSSDLAWLLEQAKEVAALRSRGGSSGSGAA